MQTRGIGTEFIPCPTPSNAYAFTGLIYLNPADFEALKQTSKYKVNASAKDILVKSGRFILKAEPLDLIQQGQVALSAFHREMLAISKLDKVYISIANLTDANPLSEIEVNIEHKLRGSGPDIQMDDKGALKIEEDDIATAIFNVFKNGVVNTGQKFAFPMFEEKVVLICSVDKITPINVKSTLTYGILQDLDTVDIICNSRNK